MTAAHFTANLPWLEAAPAGDWTIIWPGFLPLTMNEREGYLSAHKRPPYKDLSGMVFGERKKVERFIEKAVTEQRIPAATGVRVVQLTFQKTSRGQDDDPGNLWSRTKNLLDALVKSGALVDDNRKWLVLPEPLQTRGPEKATIIAISDVRAVAS